MATTSQIQLADPVPRIKAIRFRRYVFTKTSVIYLDKPRYLPARSFVEVLERRRTSRVFEELSLEELSTFLWVGLKTRELRTGLGGGAATHLRPSPSAGGVHPIEVLVLDTSARALKCFLYDANAHALHQLAVRPKALKQFIGTVRSTISMSRATLIWLIGDRNRLREGYMKEASLLWRDAGVVLATLSFTAEYLRLASCVVGTLALPNSLQLFSNNKQLVSMGGLLLGARAVRQRSR